MYRAWKQAFADIEQVEVSQGDIFDVTADALVSPANSFGYMDGGIDLTYSLRFGWELQGRLQRLLRREHDGELPVGQAVLIETGDRLYPWLVCAPTMRVPEDVSHTVNAYLAFRAVLRAVRAHNAGGAEQISTVLCPGLGTGTGRMPPGRCAHQMRMAWDICVRGLHPPYETLHDVTVCLHRPLLA